MIKTPNKKMIGLFMLIGFLSFFGIVLTAILNHFPNGENLAVMYFDESINGLNVGAPVLFKGVEIGRVVKIELETDPKTLAFSIPVYVKIKDKFLDERNFSHLKQTKTLDTLIEKGLRARLVTQSFLTGQLKIELEMLPDSKIVLKSTEKNVFEIPTVLSSMGEISKGLQGIPIHKTIQALNQTLKILNTQMPLIFPLMEKVLKNTDSTLFSISGTAQSVSEAAKSFKNMTDYLERHPESLLKGKGGY